MKILHVAVFVPESTNVWQAKGFENLGHSVIRYDYRQRARDLDGRLGNVNIKRDDELIKICQQEKPDVVIYSKCSELDIRVIHEHNKSAVTVLWYMDNKWNITDETREKMKYCNHVFCSRYDGIDEAKKHNKNVYRLQGGYDPEIHKPIDAQQIRDTLFIGHMRSDRRNYRKFYGFDTAYGLWNEKHALAVSETKINLAFNEGDGTSNRLYKILAAGGFVLTTPYKGLTEDFIIGKHLDVFSNGDEMVEKIRYYLKHEDERKTIANAGLIKVTDFNNDNYARKIIEVVK